MFKKILADLNLGSDDERIETELNRLNNEVTALKEKLASMGHPVADLKTEDTKPPVINDIFELVSHCDEVRFKELLKTKDPNSRADGIPLLHFVVRNAGPIHLKALLDSGVHVNALTEQNPASALQWITGMICKERHYFGWPRNYETQTGQLSSIGRDGIRLLDGFVGSAASIMFNIAQSLIARGAKIDFYSACALGNQEVVQNYLSTDPNCVHIPGPDGASALAWAARRGQEQIISLLLAHQAKINELNRVSQLTPLEEAIANGCTEETVKLLVQHGAWLRKGIIGVCCKSRTDLADLILSLNGNPVELVLASDIKEIQSTVYYKKMLRIFAKHGISLCEIDKEMSAQDCPLIFDGCVKSPQILRLLISMGCNINASLPEKYGDLGKMGATPMIYLQGKLRFTTSGKETLNILQRMAILFFNGTDIRPRQKKQPNPLANLSQSQVKHFLSFLYDEILLNQKVGRYGLVKLNHFSMDFLKKTIHKVLAACEPDLKGKLIQLRYHCNSSKGLTRNGVFKKNARFVDPKQEESSLSQAHAGKRIKK